jgi:hypothetical protein
MSKTIPLTKGKVAIVDDRYYPMLMTVGPWCLQSERYAASRFRGRLWLMHDLIMEWAHGKVPPGKEVDHRNRNGLDNRSRNLRYATSSQNHMNIAKRSDNTSGYKGVFWHKRAKKWMVQTKFHGRYYYGGLFANKREAAGEYNRLASEIAKEFACKNEL